MYLNLLDLHDPEPDNPDSLPPIPSHNPYRKFRKKMQKAAKKATMFRRMDTTVFLSGLIKIMWAELGQLWIDHLAAVHNKSNSTAPAATPSISPETHQNLQTHVELLQQLASKVLPVHQNSYFLEPNSTFLQTATTDRLRQYIATYKPSIISSIRQASQSMAQLGSSVSQMIRHTLTLPSAASSGTVPIPVLPSSTREAPHRKRNRLRR